MHRNRCPEAFWCYGLLYTKEIRQLLAGPNLDWRSPIEVLLGETPDSSEYMNLNFFGWVKYKDPNSGLADNISLGRWLGVAHSVGQAMTYWVLKSNGYVVARSTVWPITDEELRSKADNIARDSFMTELTTHVGDLDPDNANVPDEMMEPVFNQDFEPRPTLDSDPLTDVPGPAAATADEVSGPEPLLNAQVYLAHGDRFEIAKVIG
jgi:hypothetical protein